MKLITAIVNKKDSSEVGRKLRDAGFYFTKIATVGGFLDRGNVTMLIGVEDDKVDDVLKIIRKNSAQRMETVPEMHYHEGMEFMMAYPTEVLVGGATVFVTNVERFEKM